MVLLRFGLTPDSAVRIHDLLSCLAKFNDAVSLEAHTDHVSLSALNSSKSGYASFVLGPRFFTFFKFQPDDQNESGKFTCSIVNKALMSIFKARINDGRSRETAISRCEVSIQDTEENARCRLVIKMFCTHGATKVYHLTYEAKDIVHALFDRGTANNHWTAQVSLLRPMIEHFSPKAEQLDIYAEGDTVTFLSFTEKVVSSKNEILKQPLKTAIAIPTRNFVDISAPEKLHIVISAKDFRAVILHAATSPNTTIKAFYSRPGRPLQFTYTYEGMTAMYTLMTAGDYGDTPAPSAEPAVRIESISRAPSIPENDDRPSPRDDNQRTAPSMASTESHTIQPDMSIDMPPPAKPESRGARRTLGQSSATGRAKQMPPVRDDPDSLFVAPQPAFARDDDEQWDPADYDNDKPGDFMGWNASARNDAIHQPMFRDTQTMSMSRSHSVSDVPEGLPPTQPISQIKRALW